MNISSLREQLNSLPIPEVRYFDTIGSTNDEALAWALTGAADGCLVVADQQTQGRGRMGRQWITHPGAALAFSLILDPKPQEVQNIGFFSPLGALAISQALEELLGLQPAIKWPNDVLLNRKKTAGILVEAGWQGDTLQGVVIGIGINITSEAVPTADQVLFPATSVEQAAGKAVDRWELLRAILKGMFSWRKRLQSEAFFRAWQDRLAFKGEWVRIEQATGSPHTTALHGQVTGLDSSGSLLLRTETGEVVAVSVGDVHLRVEE